MKLFTALFDAVLLPVAAAVDVLTILPRKSIDPACESFTRQQARLVDEDLRK